MDILLHLPLEIAIRTGIRTGIFAIPLLQSNAPAYMCNNPRISLLVSDCGEDLERCSAELYASICSQMP